MHGSVDFGRSLAQPHPGNPGGTAAFNALVSGDAMLLVLYLN